MNSKFKIYVALFLVVFTCFSFDLLNCDGYYATQKGRILEMKATDNKNKVTGKSVIEIVENKHEGGKNIAVVKNIATDLKKNKTTESSYELVCDDMGISINIIKTVQDNLKKSNQLNQTTVTGNNPIYPNEMKVGQTLPESKIKIDIKGEISMESGVKIYDRKVIATEKLSVEGGTFDCVVITYTEETSFVVSKTKKYKVWMAKGVGIVKSEEYDKKGKLEKIIELTKLSN
jgi:hypothetical protein